MIHLINSALNQSINSLIQEKHHSETQSYSESDLPMQNDLVVDCNLIGNRKEFQFLLSFPNELIIKFMNELVDINHKSRDYDHILSSIVSEIGNYTACSLARSSQIIKVIGNAEVSVPRVWKWQNGNSKLPGNLQEKAAINYNGHFIQTFLTITDLNPSNN